MFHQATDVCGLQNTEHLSTHSGSKDQQKEMRHSGYIEVHNMNERMKARRKNLSDFGEDSGRYVEIPRQRPCDRPCNASHRNLTLSRGLFLFLL